MIWLWKMDRETNMHLFTVKPILNDLCMKATKKKKKHKIDQVHAVLFREAFSHLHETCSFHFVCMCVDTKLQTFPYERFINAAFWVSFCRKCVENVCRTWFKWTLQTRRKIAMEIECVRRNKFSKLIYLSTIVVLLSIQCRNWHKAVTVLAKQKKTAIWHSLPSFPLTVFICTPRCVCNCDFWTPILLHNHSIHNGAAAMDRQLCVDWIERGRKRIVIRCVNTPWLNKSRQKQHKWTYNLIGKNLQT